MFDTGKWERGAVVRSLFQNDIQYFLPLWRKRVFTLRCKNVKQELLFFLADELKKRDMKGTVYTSLNMPELNETALSVYEFATDLTALEEPFIPETLSRYQCALEKKYGESSWGILCRKDPADAEKKLLKEKGFLYCINEEKKNPAIGAATDFYQMTNTAVNGNFPEKMKEVFLQKDLYGGVFSHFCLLLDERLTEKDLKEKIVPFLDLLAGKEIVNMTDGEYIRYCTALHALRTGVSGSMGENISSLPLYLTVNDRKILLAPGEKFSLQRRNENEDARQGEEGIQEEEKYVCSITKVPEEPFTQGKPTSFPDRTVFFPGGCRKTLTFSYDDGNRKDKELIRILNRYGMKGTFNLNANGILDAAKAFQDENWSLDIYRGHEIAGHGLFHYSFAARPLSTVASCLFMDRVLIEDFSGDILCGHAFPNGTSSGAVPCALDFLRASGYIYARGSANTMEFTLPEDFLLWEQTSHHSKGILELAEKFLEDQAQKDLMVFAVWGHVSELLREDGLLMMESFCKKLSGREKGIWYATNKEIAEYVLAVRSLRWAVDGSFVRNVSARSIWIARKGRIILLKSGEKISF